MSDNSSPAVAADSAAAPLGARSPVTPTTTADAAGRGGNTLPPWAARVEGVSPYRGYSLVWYGQERADVRGYDNLAVVDPWGSMLDLDVARFDFWPTDARFRWLVDAGFPTRAAFGLIGPITETHIDAQIAAEKVAA